MTIPYRESHGKDFRDVGRAEDGKTACEEAGKEVPDEDHGRAFIEDLDQECSQR
jgi:hypothetical protein